MKGLVSKSWASRTRATIKAYCCCLRSPPTGANRRRETKLQKCRRINVPPSPIGELLPGEKPYLMQQTFPTYKTSPKTCHNELGTVLRRSMLHISTTHCANASPVLLVTISRNSHCILPNHRRVESMRSRCALHNTDTVHHKCH